MADWPQASRLRCLTVTKKSPALRRGFQSAKVSPLHARNRNQGSVMIVTRVTEVTRVNPSNPNLRRWFSTSLLPLISSHRRQPPAQVADVDTSTCSLVRPGSVLRPRRFTQGSGRTCVNSRPYSPVAIRATSRFRVLTVSWIRDCRRRSGCRGVACWRRSRGDA